MNWFTWVVLGFVMPPIALLVAAATDDGDGRTNDVWLGIACLFVVIVVVVLVIAERGA